MGRGEQWEEGSSGGGDSGRRGVVGEGSSDGGRE